jgi:hypothetical protein
LPIFTADPSRSMHCHPCEAAPRVRTR